MTPERWQQVEELFFAVLEQPADSRPAFLAEACGDDDDLHREITALLAANTHTSGRLENAIQQVADLVTQDLPGSTPSKIGPYEILEKIGSGGLSTVYLAERADGQYRMKVAIKLVRRGMESRDILERLRQERQILAHLSHPNIANLLDGGTTEDGLPYFVMEFIDGQELDHFCDGKRLTLEERLQLFLPICAAVQYAHRNLIIHRDLKPGNILITADGVPKLLDFGIAKLLDPSFAPQQTQTGLRLLTPDYASPEQLAGSPLTTSSDVYSLGVVLYRMLCGRSPFPEDRRPLSNRPTTWSVEEIDKPSHALALAGADDVNAQAAYHRKTTREKLARRLRGDLDVIVTKALRFEPERRYRTVEQMANDIRRHLDQRPILARDENFWYYWQTFVRRNRVAVVAAFLVVASLVLGLVTTIWQARIAEANAAEALQQQSVAETVSDFLIDLFNAPDPSESLGVKTPVDVILARGADKIGRELRDQPEVQATLRQTIGRVYQNLAAYDEAELHFETAFELRRGVFGDDHPEVATSRTYLAGLRADIGELAVAEDHLRRALEIQTAYYDAEHPDIAQTLNDLGVLLRLKGEPHEAERLARLAFEQRQQLLGEDHPETAQSLSNLATVLYDLNETDAAERHLQRVLELRRQRLGPEHPDTIQTLSNLGQVLARRGKLDPAVAAAREVLEARRKILPEGHPKLAVSLNNLANLLIEQEKPEKALPHLEDALTLLRDTRSEDYRRMSVLLINRAEALTQLGDVPRAREDLRQAIEFIERQFPGTHHPRLLRPLKELARLEDDPKRRLELQRHIVRIYEASSPDARLVLARNDVAISLLNLGEIEQARTEHLAAKQWLAGLPEPDATLREKLSRQAEMLAPLAP